MGEQVGNALGRGLGAINSVIAIRNGQLAQQQAAQAAALGNPTVRAGLVNSPFAAGTLGLSGGQRALPTTQPLNQYNPNAPAQTSQVNVPQQFAWQPNLPALSPEEQLKQAQAQAGVDLSVYDPTTFRAASNAGTPEDVGAIIKRATPQGVGNVTARTGGLGMFQLGIPQQVVDLGGGQYGITDPQTGGIRTVGQQPGASVIAAQNAEIANQRAARARMVGPQGFSQAQPVAPGATTVQTPRGPMQVPTAMQEAANITQTPAVPQPQPPTTAQAASVPSGTPKFGGTAIPFDQLNPHAPLNTIVQQPGFPSTAPQGQAPPPPPPSASQQIQPYQTPPPAPGQLQPPQPAYNPFLEEPGFTTGKTLGGPVTQVRTENKATGDVAVITPTGPKLDPMQVRAKAIFNTTDISSLDPSQVAYLLDQEKIAEDSKAKNAAMLQGSAAEETARIANLMSISQALSELRWMGPGIYQYVGKKYSQAGLQRGLAGLSVGGDPGYEHVKTLTSQLRILAFTFGGQQLTETEAARVDAMIPQISDSPAAFKAKASRTSKILQKQMEILLAGRGAHLAPSAIQSIQDTYQQIHITPPSETP